MPARFDDLVPYFDDKVIAIGPLHPSENIKEVCAWVLQAEVRAWALQAEVRASDEAATKMTTDLLTGRDAAATEMTTNVPTGKELFQQVDGKRWLLPLEKISVANFRAGKAFAVAVALVADLTAPNNERVVWWGQPVDLYESQANVDAALEAGALERPPLQDPAPFPPAH